MTAFPIIERPLEADARPVVVSSPHSGCEFPVEERGLYREPISLLARDGDLFVDRLYKNVASLGATFVTTPYSRFVVDLNRLPDDVTPQAVDGATAPRGPGYYGDRGVIWTISPRGRAVYLRPLTQGEFLRRRASYYDPYHEALRTELERLRARFGYAILLDAHSMPSRSPRAGAARPDIVPGDLLGAACGEWVRELTVNHFTELGYSVRPNSPYRGGGITRQHGRPDAGIHAVQLEVSRSLYMNERTFAPTRGLATLRRHCEAYVAALCAAEPPSVS